MSRLNQNLSLVIVITGIKSWKNTCEFLSLHSASNSLGKSPVELLERACMLSRGFDFPACVLIKDDKGGILIVMSAY